MPNYIQNRLTIEGSEKEIQSLFKSIRGEKAGQLIDFAKIIPPPANLFRGAISDEDKERLNAQGIPNWFDWNNANWAPNGMLSSANKSMQILSTLKRLGVLR